MPSINTFNTPESKGKWVSMVGLSLLKNSLQVAPYFDTSFNENFEKEFPIGRSMAVPLSQRYISQRNNMAYNAQALSRPSTTITCDQTSTITFDWESVEKALDMERGEARAKENYLKPAIAYIRQDIDSDCAQFAYQNLNMVTGALGTNPATFDATSAAARAAMAEMGCPIDGGDLGLFLPPQVTRAVKGSALTYMNPQPDITKQYRTGMIGVADGFDFMESNSLYTHTAGVWATPASVTVNGNNQSGSSLNINCTSGDTFKQGDKFSIAAVNQVNLMTRRTTSTSSAGTKTFTVTADVTASASTATLTIYPPINGPGSQYQNVDALPATLAVLTLWPGTTAPSTGPKAGKVGFGLYKGAFMLVGISLELPKNVEVKSQTQDPETQIAIRFVRDWDNRTSSMTNRLDSCWGRGVGLAEQCGIVIACA